MAKTARKSTPTAKSKQSGATATRKTAAPKNATSKSSPRASATPISNLAAEATKWTFLTNHCHVLILLAQDSEMVLREVAQRVGITERAVQRIIADLEEGGFVIRERIGRRNRYQIRTEVQLRHPIEAHRTIGDLLDLVNLE